MEWWITEEGKSNKNLLIEKITVSLSDDVKIIAEGEERPQQRIKFWLTSDALIHYKFNKKIKVRWIKSPPSLSEYGGFILEPKTIEMTVVESEDSAQKERLLNLRIRKEEAVKIEIKAEKQVVKSSSIRGAAVAAVVTSFAIFVRYFVVVDIVINLFGKINVELGPKIGNIVIFLKKLEFPDLSGAQNTSIINDGGKYAIEQHNEFIKNKGKSISTQEPLKNTRFDPPPGQVSFFNKLIFLGNK